VPGRIRPSNCFNRAASRWSSVRHRRAQVSGWNGVDILGGRLNNRPRPAVPLCVGVLIGLVAVGCASAHTSNRSGSRASPRTAVSASTSTSTSVRRRIPPVRSTTTTGPVEQPGWLAVSAGRTGYAIDERAFAFADGTRVTVARFRVGRTRFALHAGSQDPPTRGMTIPANAGPAVGKAELSNLLAAFNGGFKLSSGSGGFELDGQMLQTLTLGTASFVIDADGSGHVGVWGQDLPRPGEQITSVRQNLQPLVHDSQLSQLVSQIKAWGSTFKGESMAARSAVGEDSRGDILYAASMSALPIDLGNALIVAGATAAMELDINPEWVQLAVSTRAGGPLFPGVPGQHRPSNQYIMGWTRDFVTVLATR